MWDHILETAGDSVDGDVDARHDCCFVYVCAGAVVVVVLSVLSRVSKVCVVVLVPGRLHVLIAVFNACTSPGGRARQQETTARVAAVVRMWALH